MLASLKFCQFSQEMDSISGEVSLMNGTVFEELIFAFWLLFLLCGNISLLILSFLTSLARPVYEHQHLYCDQTFYGVIYFLPD